MNADKRVVAAVAGIAFLSCALAGQSRPSSGELKAAEEASRDLADAKAAEGRGDLATAELKYKQMLAIAKRYKLGAGLESAALRGLGQVESARHNDSAALEYAKQDLEAIRRMPGEPKADLEDTLGQVAALSFSLGHEAEGERYWKESLALLESCPSSERRCRLRYWDAYGTMAGTLFLHNQDERAGKMLQEILGAPEAEVRPLVLLVALRAQTAILMRNARPKEAFAMQQRSSAYERAHPEVVAQLGPSRDPAMDRAGAKVREIVRQAMTGKLARDEDFSSYGIYSVILQLFRDAMFGYQENGAEERKRIQDLGLGAVLSAAAVKDMTSLEASRGKVRAAMLEEDRAVVKSQNISSGLEKALNERMASSAPDEKTMIQASVVGVTGAMEMFRDRVVAAESYSRQSLTRLDEVLQFLERRLGHYTVDGARLQFDNAEDQTTYEAGVLSVRELAGKAVAIQNQMMEEIRKLQVQ